MRKNNSSMEKVRLQMNKGKVHDTCIKFVMLYAVEAWLC